jgi:hypothetical protein
MKVSDLSRALTACALVTVLAGCNNGGMQFSPSSMQQKAARSSLNTNAVSAKPDMSPLSGEVFTANKVSVRITECHKTGPILGYAAHFTASGEAKGPYPGALFVKGNWSKIVGIGHASWGFYEKFTITSRKNTLSGLIEVSDEGKTPWPSIECATFGPVISEGFLTYRSGSWSGPVTIPYKIREGHLGEEKLH